MLPRLFGVVFSVVMVSCSPSQPEPIRIGVIHALTGPMAVSEAPLVDAARLAVEEVNAAGGLLGRPVEMLVADSASDPRKAAEHAWRMIETERVAALFACWTSSCRRMVKPVVESHGHLLFYPVQYEGLEQSNHIVYTGSAPNQQIVPGAHWAMRNLGKRVYLLGSDYVFPRIAHRIIADLAKASNATVLAERYRPLGDSDFSREAAEIARLQPDVVFNTVNGESNIHLFRALRDAGLVKQPIMSFSIAEGELAAIKGAGLTEHYAVWNYFQSLDSADNRRFIDAFRRRFGGQRVTSDPVEASYIGVKLWAQAVSDAGSERIDLVNRAIQRQSIAAPSGILSVDSDSRHLWKMVRIGKARADGDFDIVHDSRWPLHPAPFPLYHSRRYWLDVVRDVVEE